MSDLISRQAAIDALGDEPEVWTGKDEYAMGLNNQWHYDRNAIKAVPSAQPCYKTDHGYMWLCPECGLAVHSDYTRCVRCGWERRTDETD